MSLHAGGGCTLGYRNGFLFMQGSDMINVQNAKWLSSLQMRLALSECMTHMIAHHLVFSQRHLHFLMYTHVYICSIYTHTLGMFVERNDLSDFFQLIS